MRRAAANIALCLALVAVASPGCSRRDTSSVKSDVSDAGRNLHQEATQVRQNPNVRQAETDLKKAGKEASTDVKKAAADARAALDQLLASEARHSARDRSRDDQEDHHPQS
jgi:hypothetical protein